MKSMLGRRLLAAAVVTVAVGASASVPASALSLPAPVNLAPAAAADAYGLDVDVKLTQLNVPVNNGPTARASQEFPPAVADPDEAELFGVGPLPAGGEVVQSIGVLTSIAGANGTPLAVASSQAVDVRLLAQNGTPMITADVVRAQSTTDCVNDPTAAGTEFVNLRVAGFSDPIPEPTPNMELLPLVFNPLGLKVVLNEQNKTADGRGLVVNAIHIYNFNPPLVPGLFSGDVIVAHAMSTVNCPNGKGSTGSDSDIFIVKDANKTQAKPGEEVTYTATVQNKSSDSCLVNQFIEHMPSAFDFVSTSGQFGTSAATANRPGGGVDLILKPTGLTIPGGGSATQTFVLKVKDTAVPGIYFNNVEILCANLGNWAKGLDAPVEVTTQTDVEEPRKPQCSDAADNDGDGKVDFPNDPGCDSPLDDDERDAPRSLPRTGGPDHLMLAGFLLLAASAAVATRRKSLR